MFVRFEMKNKMKFFSKSGKIKYIFSSKILV